MPTTSVDNKPNSNNCCCPALSCETTSGKFFQTAVLVSGVVGAIFCFLQGQPMSFTIAMGLVPVSIITINVIIKCCCAPKKQEQNPYPNKLFHAVAFGTEEDVKRQLAQPFDPGALFERDTVLLFSLYMPKLNKIKLLLDSNKFDLATKNQFGETVLEHLLLNINNEPELKKVIYLVLQKNPDLKTALSKPDFLVKLFIFLFKNKNDPENTFLDEFVAKIKNNELGDFGSTTNLLDNFLQKEQKEGTFFDYLCLVIEARPDFPQKALEIVSQKIGVENRNSDLIFGSEQIYQPLLNHLNMEVILQIPALKEQIFNLFKKFRKDHDQRFWKYFFSKFKDAEKLKGLMSDFSNWLSSDIGVDQASAYRPLNDFIWARVQKLEQKSIK